MKLFYYFPLFWTSVCSDICEALRCAWTYAWICEGLKEMPSVFLNHFRLMVLVRVSHWTWSQLSTASGQWAAAADIFLCMNPSPGVYFGLKGFLLGHWGSQLMYLCFKHKYFIKWAIYFFFFWKYFQKIAKIVPSCLKAFMLEVSNTEFQYVLRQLCSQINGSQVTQSLSLNKQIQVY